MGALDGPFYSAAGCDGTPACHGSDCFKLMDTRGICDSTSREDVSLLAESPALRRDMKRYIGVQE